MSYSFACRHCGYYESAHGEPDVAEDWFASYEVAAEDVLPGYAKSYSDCEGYESENPKAEKEALEYEIAEIRAKGEIMGQQAFILMSYSPVGTHRPFFHVSDSCGG